MGIFKENCASKVALGLEFSELNGQNECNPVAVYSFCSAAHSLSGFVSINCAVSRGQQFTELQNS